MDNLALIIIRKQMFGTPWNGIDGPFGGEALTGAGIPGNNMLVPKLVIFTARSWSDSYSIFDLFKFQTIYEKYQIKTC